MYFFLAFWYVVATIGAVSIFVFFFLALSVFDEKAIKQYCGYRNYFIFLGGYILVAVPFAATLADGINNGNFLFCLGCLCPALWELDEKLTQNHQLKQAKMLSAQMSGTAIPTQQPDFAQAVQRPDPGPAYVPAPSTLSADFDVPPQR